MPQSTHAYEPDPCNQAILIDVNGTLLAREDAKVSDFDSVFVLGDSMRKRRLISSSCSEFRPGKQARFREKSAFYPTLKASGD